MYGTFFYGLTYFGGNLVQLPEDSLYGESLYGLSYFAGGNTPAVVGPIILVPTGGSSSGGTGRRTLEDAERDYQERLRLKQITSRRKDEQELALIIGVWLNVK